MYNGISNYSTLRSAMAEKQALQERIDALVEENSRLQSEQFELQRLRELYESGSGLYAVSEDWSQGHCEGLW